MTSRTLIILAIVVFAIAIGAPASHGLSSRAPGLRSASVLTVPSRLPDFSAIDHRGRTVGREIFQGQWDLVFFGFTHCPHVCPLTLQALSRARNQLAKDGQEPLPRIVLVSVDPERDTPERLADYIKNLDDSILGITGDLEEIRRLASGLAIFFDEASGEAEDDNLDHSSAVMVINADGEVSARFTPPHKVESFVHDLPIVMRGS